MNRLIYLLATLFLSLGACAQQPQTDSRYYRPLNSKEQHVIIQKGTDLPFQGKYDDFWKDGIYVCKQCGAPLYRSSDKFDGHCGWPSFDDAFPNAIIRRPDPDGLRTEIICARCGAHLGHVFLGEGFTAKNTRHCVNSTSLIFIPAHSPQNASQDTAYFAGGCFWGVEYFLAKAPGVIKTITGYMGGHTQRPTYEQVSSHTTGYAETVEVIFSPAKTTYEKLAKYFFEIHDPTEFNRQGPDIGDQYRSEIFYRTVDQFRIAQQLIQQLEKNDYPVVTRLNAATPFYPAKAFHQNYYSRTGGKPYCHHFVKRF